MSDLQCYCCGEPIGEQFAVVSMSQDADRVFVAKLEHVRRLDHLAVVVSVRRLEPRKEW